MDATRSCVLLPLLDRCSKNMHTGFLKLFPVQQQR